MSDWIRRLDEIDAIALAEIGGKGADLARLVSAGLPVPPGFCITTRAFRRHVDDVAGFADLLADLEALAADDVDGARSVGARARAWVIGRAIPEEVEAAIVRALEDAGPDHAYAVRSSATAEDLPDASFAGQQDTYLNVRGRRGVLDGVRGCWASLYTDRAILYRAQNAIAHRDVALAVVVQRMVRSETSGILFTADPLSGHRHIVSIDAGFGLGEALVSGRVSADLYRVDTRTRSIVEQKIGDKPIAVVPIEGGGTREAPLSVERRHARVLSPEHIERLVDVGVRIERLQGAPQDIEWCFENGELFVVQTRPITSLFPLPRPAPSDGTLHVSVCVNHFQVMTDAMPEMSLSIWRLLLPFGKAPGEIGPSPWVTTAGGRLYLDLSRPLRVPAMRRAIVGLLGGVDRLTADAVAAVTARPEFSGGPRASVPTVLSVMGPQIWRLLANVSWRGSRGAASRLAARLDALLAEVQESVRAQADAPGRLRSLRSILGLVIHRVLHIPAYVLAGLVAGRLLRRVAAATDGEVQTLGRGLVGNVTTDMDLAVGDLADVARRAPALRDALLLGASTGGTLADIPGGDAFIERRASSGTPAGKRWQRARSWWRPSPTRAGPRCSSTPPGS